MSCEVPVSLGLSCQEAGLGHPCWSVLGCELGEWEGDGSLPETCHSDEEALGAHVDLYRRLQLGALRSKAADLGYEHGTTRK